MKAALHFIVLTSFLCACSIVSAEDASEMRRAVYLPRIAILEGETSNFSTPLMVRSDGWAPRNLTQAIDEMAKMVPALANGSVVAAEISACKQSLDETWQLQCEVALCRRLPPGTADEQCTYFVRLEKWVQANWLGSSCYAADFSPKTPLAKWFSRQGVNRCSDMSDLYWTAFLLAITGHQIDAEKLARSMRDVP